jgi:hypothetical protein
MVGRPLVSPAQPLRRQIQGKAMPSPGSLVAFALVCPMLRLR